MIRIGVEGNGRMVSWLRAAIDAQPDLMAYAPDSETRVSVVCAQDEESILIRSCGAHAVNGDEAPPLLFHPCWNYVAALHRPVLRVPDSATIAVLRILAGLPDVRRVHVTALLSAGVAGSALHGPIDALVPQSSAATNELLPVVDWTIQAVLVPHTRCHLLGCFVEMTGVQTQDSIRARLARVSRVVCAPEAFRLLDTAALSEFFRDLGRPAGEFIETVVFENIMVIDNLVFLWVASHPKSVIAEVIDCIRAMLGLAPAAETSIRMTDKALEFVQLR